MRNDNIMDKNMIEKYKKVKVGDTVDFGSYPQTEIIGNEITKSIRYAKYNDYEDTIVDGIKIRRLRKEEILTIDDEVCKNISYRYFKYEPIMCDVKEKDENGILTLVSRNIIDCIPYHNVFDSITWTDASIREWLNYIFYVRAFNNIQKRILVHVDNINNTGNITKDRVFLLSVDEVNKLYSGIEERVKYGSDYTNVIINNENNTKSISWWLRNQGNYGRRASYVYYNGFINSSGSNVNIKSGIVPVFKINPLQCLNDF